MRPGIIRRTYATDDNGRADVRSPGPRPNWRLSRGLLQEPESSALQIEPCTQRLISLLERGNLLA